MKKILPLWLKRNIRGVLTIITTFCYYWSDMQRFLRFSTTMRRPWQYNQLEARIISHYHALEKALSFRDKKDFFGEEVSKSLMDLLEKYTVIGYDTSKVFFQAALDTLEKYVVFHQNNKKIGIYLEDIKRRMLKLATQNSKGLGGTLKLRRQDILEAGRGNFAQLAYSRHSIRDFSNEEVNIEIILESIKIAQACPSECNRQTTQVIVVSEKELVKKALRLQTGNRGFGHLVDKLLVIVSDLGHFEGAIERNQIFVDGGIFSMSLLYALHYKGLGACPLNWASSPRKDHALRNILKLSFSTTVIVLIAVGNIPEELYVTMSTRKNVEDIVENR